MIWSSIQVTKTFSISVKRLFCFLINSVFTGVAFLISFKNFSFAFRTWLSGGGGGGVQMLSCFWLFMTPWTAVRQASLSFTTSWSLLNIVSDANRPSHPLSPLSPDLNLSQHQGLFQWAGSSHQAAKILGLQLQHQSFQWISRVDFL